MSNRDFTHFTILQACAIWNDENFDDPDNPLIDPLQLARDFHDRALGADTTLWEFTQYKTKSPIGTKVHVEYIDSAYVLSYNKWSFEFDNEQSAISSYRNLIGKALCYEGFPKQLS